MKSSITAIYKGIKQRKAGSFTNDNGQIIKYTDSYKIIFDQYIADIPKETELKVTKEIALNLIPNLKPYDKIVINLDITIYGNNNIALNVVSIEKK